MTLDEVKARGLPAVHPDGWEWLFGELILTIDEDKAHAMPDNCTRVNIPVLTPTGFGADVLWVPLDGWRTAEHVFRAR